jgi:hypothetical protein
MFMPYLLDMVGLVVFARHLKVFQPAPFLSLLNFTIRARPLI